jgi:hypothetical protein
MSNTYTGRRFNDETAVQFVKDFMNTIPSLDQSAISTAVECAYEAWNVFANMTTEECEAYNDAEALRWFFVILKQFVGDDKEIPKTWTRRFD